MAFNNSKSFEDITAFLNGLNETSASTMLEVNNVPESAFTTKFKQVVQSAPPITVDPVARIKEYAKRLNDNLDAVSFEGLTDEQTRSIREKCKIKVKESPYGKPFECKGAVQEGIFKNIGLHLSVIV